MSEMIQRPLAEMRDILMVYRLGSPRTKKGYMTVMKRIIKDLFYLKMGVNSFKEVRWSHLEKLIAHWKRRQLSLVTIASRVSILRKYVDLLQHDLPIPTNADLGLIRKHQPVLGITLETYESILAKVYHPVVKQIIQMQALLGLSAHEAMDFRLQPYDQVLYIAKAVSHGNKDRLVPIRFPDQLALIKTFLPASLSDRYTKPLVTKLYHAELVLLGVEIDTAFKSVYAKRSFRDLIPSTTPKLAIQQIAKEMGIMSVQTIKRWVHE